MVRYVQATVRGTLPFPSPPPLVVFIPPSGDAINKRTRSCPVSYLSAQDYPFPPFFSPHVCYFFYFLQLPYTAGKLTHCYVILRGSRTNPFVMPPQILRRNKPVYACDVIRTWRTARTRTTSPSDVRPGTFGASSSARFSEPGTTFPSRHPL